LLWPALALLLVGLSGKLMAGVVTPGQPGSGWSTTWHSVIERSFWAQADLFSFGMIAAVAYVEIEDRCMRLEPHLASRGARTGAARLRAVRLDYEPSVEDPAKPSLEAPDAELAIFLAGPAPEQRIRDPDGLTVGRAHGLETRLPRRADASVGESQHGQPRVARASLQEPFGSAVRRAVDRHDELAQRRVCQQGFDDCAQGLPPLVRRDDHGDCGRRGRCSWAATTLPAGAQRRRRSSEERERHGAALAAVPTPRRP
jgi:hypothetical protein